MEKRMILLVFGLGIGNLLHAQATDSVALYKKFVQVCNAYKQVPLQLNVAITKNTNVPTRADDILSTKGEFYVNKDAAYIHFGNAEQIITDSMMLMVMKENNQMVLLKGKVDIGRQISSMLRLTNDDSAAFDFLQRYRIILRKDDHSQFVLELTNKKMVFSTTLPTEHILLTYDSHDNNPISVETVQRSLIKKPGDEKVNQGISTITVEGKGDFLIKEDKVSYLFTNIEHRVGVAMPVQLSDRVVRTDNDSYSPVNTYKNFNLIQH